MPRAQPATTGSGPTIKYEDRTNSRSGGSFAPGTLREVAVSSEVATPHRWVQSKAKTSHHRELILSEEDTWRSIPETGDKTPRKSVQSKAGEFYQYQLIPSEVDTVRNILEAGDAIPHNSVQSKASEFYRHRLHKNVSSDDRAQTHERFIVTKYACDRWRYENVEHKHKFRMLVVANTKLRWDPEGEICLRVIETDQINRMTKEDGCLRSVGHDPHHHDTNTSNHCAPQQHPKCIIFTPQPVYANRSRCASHLAYVTHTGDFRQQYTQNSRFTTRLWYTSLGNHRNIPYQNGIALS